MSVVLFYSCTWEGLNALLNSLASFCGARGDGRRGLVLHQNHLMEEAAMLCSCGRCLLLNCSSVALSHTDANRADIKPSPKCTLFSLLLFWSPKTLMVASIQKYRCFTLCSKSDQFQQKQILILSSSPLASPYSIKFGYSGMSSLHAL